MEKQKKILNLNELEKLKLFEVEELEDRLETAWNEGCGETNNQCQNSNCGVNSTCDGITNET
jgi:hypothetical protein